MKSRSVLGAVLIDSNRVLQSLFINIWQKTNHVKKLRVLQVLLTRLYPVLKHLMASSGRFPDQVRVT